MNENLLHLFDDLYAKAKIQLVKDGFHTPLAFLIERTKTSGKVNVAVVPLNFDDLNKKQQTFNLLGQELKTGKYQGYIMITEGWIVVVDKKDKEKIDLSIPPSQNPNKKECVIVRLQDEFGEMKSNIMIFEKHTDLISKENPNGIKIIKEQKDDDDGGGTKEEKGRIKDVWR